MRENRICGPVVTLGLSLVLGLIFHGSLQVMAISSASQGKSPSGGKSSTESNGSIVING